MSYLPNVDKAIAKKQDQLERAIKLPINHLEILAANAGRFAEDEFLIFFHELQLRKALEQDATIDVTYARQKINEFADECISVIMTRDLMQYHVAACHRPTYVSKKQDTYMQVKRRDWFQQRNHNAISRLANRI